MLQPWLKVIEEEFERRFGLQGVRTEFGREAVWAELDKVLWVRVLRQRRP